MPGAVAEQHQHGQELLRLLRVVAEALQEELQPPVGPQLADERPQLGQQVIKVGETWKRPEEPKLQTGAPFGPSSPCQSGRRKPPGSEPYCARQKAGAISKEIIITVRITTANV